LWDSAAGALPARFRLSQGGDKARKLAALLGANDIDAVYRVLVSQWDDPLRIMQVGHEPATPLSDRALARDVPNAAERMQVLDLMTYLPDDILTKVDRATMAVGLEGRVPLLDHRVVEFSWRLPMSLKVRDGQGKWLLKRVLSRYVPTKLTSRPKMGFGMPIGAWLRGPLRDWAEDLLSSDALESDGILRAEPIRQLWRLHLNGTAAAHYQLWPILVFQAWRRRWH
jgi:asparagine synthase (glutamine-hydrolysing)